MKLSEYIQREISTNETSQKIVEIISEFSTDEEYIAGVLLDLKNDDDKTVFLEYLQKGVDVDYEQIILWSLWLNQQRKQKENG